MTVAPSEPSPGRAPLDADALVSTLRATFASGRTRELDWRRDQLRAVRRMLVDHEDDFLDALAADLGKPRLEGWSTEVGYLVTEVDHLLRHLGRWSRGHRVPVRLALRPGRARVLPEPLGVVLVIAPWNFPLHLVLAPLVGAIAAGNCVIAKPSELAPHTSASVAALTRQYLDPTGVVIVEGGPAEAQALLEQPLDRVLFTGSARVGRLVMQAASRQLVPVTLELGGKSPAIVDEDADVEVAARRVAWGKYLNAGQTCIAPDYVLVPRSLEERFVEHVRVAINEFYGPEPERSPDYGRIVNDAHLERLRGLLAGGRVSIGGQVDPGARYFAPTVLQDVDPTAPVMTEEVFGPILPVIPVEGTDEAVAFVRARPKPLALYLFTRSRAARRHVLAATSSGGVAVNTTLLQAAVPGLPFGGVGPSGMGAYHGRASFDTFSHARAVLTRSTHPDLRVAYPPFTRTKARVYRKLL